MISVDLTRIDTTDAQLKILSGLPDLRVLKLGNKITDARLKHISGLTMLTNLELCRTQVSDEGLQHLSGLTGLKELDLGNTKITDAGLKHILSFAVSVIDFILRPCSLSSSRAFSAAACPVVLAVK